MQPPPRSLGVTGIQQDWNPVPSRPLAAWRNRSPGLKSDEAREDLRHTGAAGQDNLPSVLSGFTPVLPVTPERGIKRRLLFIVGRGGRQGGETICGRESGQDVALEGHIQRG